MEKMSVKIGEGKMMPYFNHYTTSHYKLSFFKSVTGLYFILITSLTDTNFKQFI